MSAARRRLAFALLAAGLAVSAVGPGASCACEEEPQGDGEGEGPPLIGDGPPADRDAGPPYERDAGPVVCVDDPLEDNDARDDAQPVVTADPVTATFCGEDDDWFVLDTLAGCSVLAELTFTQDAE